MQPRRYFEIVGKGTGGFCSTARENALMIISGLLNEDLNRRSSYAHAFLLTQQQRWLAASSLELVSRTRYSPTRHRTLEVGACEGDGPTMLMTHNPQPDVSPMLTTRGLENSSVHENITLLIGPRYSGVDGQA